MHTRNGLHRLLDNGSTLKPVAMKNYLKCIGILLLSLYLSPDTRSQLAAPDEVKFYTEEWEGDRFPDGRPRVSKDLMERLKKISIEEVWGVLRNKGFHNQFEGDWKMVHEDMPFVGQALTAVYFPRRPDFSERMLEKGQAGGMIGAMNSWPIDLLGEGDVYVADCFGKIIDGTLIGDNLGNAIFSRSKTGVVFDGGLRDLEGLEEIDGFNAYVRGWDPSYLQETMLMGINVPVRIGNATVFPGDVVLAKREGAIFIPPHLLEEVVITAEFIMLRDAFGHQKLREGKYTPGQIDGRWSPEIKQDFLDWLDRNPGLLPMSRQQLDEYMKNRTW
jgi:4-hydroxy-4-methyl-2-oxoglutarate aldolase